MQITQMKIKNNDVYQQLDSFEGLLSLYEHNSITLCGLSERLSKIISDLTTMSKCGSLRRRYECKSVLSMILNFRDEIIGPSMDMTCAGAQYRLRHELKGWDIIQNIRTATWHTPDCYGNYPTAVTLYIRTTKGQPAIFSFTVVDKGDRIQTFHTVPGRFLVSSDNEMSNLINILENRMNWVGILRDPKLL